LGACLAVGTGPHAEAGSLEPIYRSGGAAFRVEQIYGGDIDNDATYLRRPSSLALDAKGNLFVLDREAKCIKKFNAAGEWLATIGGPGEGPGEMSMPQSIALAPDGRLLLCDWSPRRLTWYSSDGVYEDSVQFNEMGSTHISGVQVDSDATLWAILDVQEANKQGEPIPMRVSRLQMEPFEERILESAELLKTIALHQGDATTMVVAPYSAGLFWRVTAQDRIVVANSASGRVRCYSTAMQAISEFQVQTAARPLTEADRESYFAIFKDAPFVPALRRQIQFPECKPWFSQLLVDDEGFVLLQVSDDEDGVARYEVHNPDGTYLAVATLPSLTSGIIASGALYSVELHEESDYAVYRYVSEN
jgi:hypothetical protein